MDDGRDREIALLMEAAGKGDSAALDALLPLLYSELHDLAHRQRQRQGGPATLNTTALLHEAYLKLAHAKGNFQDRTHFFRIAAQAIRQIIVDYARQHQAAKRGGGISEGTLEDAHFVPTERTEEILALDEALERLAKLSSRQAEIINMRYFAGFTIPEVAEVLGISPATAWRDGAAAQAWLQQELSR